MVNIQQQQQSSGSRINVVPTAEARNRELREDEAYCALRPLLEQEHPGVYAASVNDIRTKPAHSAGLKFGKGLLAPWIFINPATWCCVGKLSPFLVPEGSIGITTNNGVVEFLPQGWHWMLSPVRSLVRIVSLREELIQQGPKAIVTVPPGKVGYAEDQGKPIVLGPGMHQWDSPTMRFVGMYPVSDKLVSLGPFTLVTVREGECAVTSDNGVLKVLGAEKAHADRANTRTYLLSHAKWRFVAWLETVEQFDILKSAELLTADRVEVDLESTVAWRIVDPITASKQGGSTDHIRELVHREARATVADLILSTKISSGIKAPDSKAKQESRSAASSGAHSDEDPLHGGVSAYAVDACSRRLERIGVNVDTINIVQLTVKDRTIRERLAQAAVISTKVQEASEIAKTEAKNAEIKARAEAEGIRLKARAQADSKTFLAEADAAALRMHAEAAKHAGEVIGANEVAKILEKIRFTGDALAQANATLFLTPGQDITNLMSNPAVVKPRGKVRPVATADSRPQAGDNDDDDDGASV